MSQGLEDKEAIRDLLSEYCVCLDNDRFAEFAALFTPDGTWETAFGSATGRADIEVLVRRIAGDPPRPKRIHMVSNIVIRLQGDRAAVTANWIMPVTGDRGPAIDSGGSYADDLAKQDGRWLFRHRRIDRYLVG